MDREGRERAKQPVAPISQESIRREKQRARDLRQTQWWKRKCDKGVCYYCGRSVPPKQLTMDHIVPLGRGGKSTRGNVVPVCKECNTKKKYLLPMEWQEYLERMGRKV